MVLLLFSAVLLAFSDFREMELGNTFFTVIKILDRESSGQTVLLGLIFIGTEVVGFYLKEVGSHFKLSGREISGIGDKVLALILLVLSIFFSEGISWEVVLRMSGFIALIRFSQFMTRIAHPLQHNAGVAASIMSLFPLLYALLNYFFQ